MRKNAINWKQITENINVRGFSKVSNALTEEQCGELRGLYADKNIYRSVISMARYRFGKGEYKYFSYPLPALIENIRSEFYSPLAEIANLWMKQLGIGREYPYDHGSFINQCHQAKQERPTPLILRYEEGGYNTLHQDLYGEVYFPFQVVFVLSKTDEEFTGGEFVLVEQVPRAQSRVEVVRLAQGDALIFTTNFRPVKGTRGYYRAAMRHGISQVTSGVRFALGVIFHDAT